MKTVEIRVSFFAQVSETTAAEIEASPEKFYLDLPLANVALVGGNGQSTQAKFTEFETVSIEALE